MIVGCWLVVWSERGWHDPVLLFFGLTQRTKGQDWTRWA